jgi:prolipoprotein diacylglyceryltransferase
LKTRQPRPSLYEAVALVPLAWLLFRWRKQGRPDAFVLGAYLVLAGTIRCLIEFLRVNIRVLGGLSVAHLASLMAIAIGLGFLFRAKRPRIDGNRRSVE